MPNFITFVFCLFIAGSFLSGCSSDSASENINRSVSISGRAEDGKRFPIYRVIDMPGWSHRHPLPDDLLEDTKKSLCDFFIHEDGETLRIAIHNFPSSSIEERIPPSAQVARWQQQLGQIDHAKTKISPQSFSGYCGLHLLTEGKVENSNSAVLGWSLQLGIEHYRFLSELAERFPEKKALYRQMRADVTIKATGSPSLMDKHRSDIENFARSFELIEEIPTQQ